MTSINIANNGKIEILNLKIESKNKDKINGFGISRFVFSFSGAVGDQFPVDYSTYYISSIANSIDGTFEFNKPFSKYHRIEVDILNSSLSNVGYPHWAIEDTFEWVNSGTPSHLSQVRDSAVLLSGIAGEKIFPGAINHAASPYQAKYISVENNDWYDQKNSTVDYDVVLDNGAKNLSIPYPNAVFNFSDKKQVWVGGLGGVLVIDVLTKIITKLPIVSDSDLLIKDIVMSSGKIYILDEYRLFIYDILTEIIEYDKSLNTPEKMYKIASVYGSNLVVSAADGIYAKKIASLQWEKVYDSKYPCEIMIYPDALFVVNSNGDCLYSTEGFIWSKVGVVTSKIVNKIEKHRSQVFFATDSGLYQDNGSFYTKNVSLQIADILSDPSGSASVGVNDIVSDFNQLVIGLSDGRCIIYSGDFEEQPDSQLDSIHKILFVNGDIWLFGYNYFKVSTENFIRKLATGVSVI